MKIITKTKYVKHLLFSIASLLSLLTFSQEKEADSKKFSLSGSVDAYYRVNLNGDNGFNTTSNLPHAAPGSSFANLPGFSLGMANVIATYEGQKVGFVGDLVFGPRGTDAIFASPLYSATGNIVNQLYVYWKVHESVKLTFGNFNTFLGYEVISPTGNYQYSTSYLFSYGPFSHTGLKVDFALSSDFTLMLAVMNPTDATELNPTGKYAFGAQLGYKGQFLNVLTDDGAFEIDFTGGFNLTEEFYLGVNAAVFEKDDLGFAGVALYPQYTIDEQFSLGLRGEYFAERGNYGAIGTETADSDVLAMTLTANVKLGNLTLIPELRLDSSSEASFNFLDEDLLPQKSLSSFVLAAVYAF
ncbi:MAG: outer membrane beta-barrel protein [Arenibacter sp.]|nr:outer membrane beta-barrel protein [Arenibacter sp.]